MGAGSGGREHRTRHRMPHFTKMRCRSTSDLADPCAPQQIKATWDPPDETLVACDKLDMGDERGARCSCVNILLGFEKPDPEEECCPQDFLLKQLAHMAPLLRLRGDQGMGCLEVEGARWCRRWQGPVLGNFHWHQSDVARQAHKKRRTVFDVKQQAVGEDTRQGSIGLSAKGLGNIPSSVSCKWRHGEMSSYRATALLQIKPPDTIAIAIDATRIGKPGRELLLGLASCTERGIHFVLPPQAWLGRALALQLCRILGCNRSIDSGW